MGLLLACAGTLAVGQSNGGRTVDMGTFTVTAPPGWHWKTHVDRRARQVLFTHRMAASDGDVPHVITIFMGQNKLLHPPRHIGEQEAADDFRNMEERGMIMKGEWEGEYELRDVTKGAVTIAGKKLYTMSYKQMNGRLFGKSAVSESTLYVYFPADFSDRHVFYMIIITQLHGRGEKPLDLTDMTSAAIEGLDNKQSP